MAKKKKKGKKRKKKEYDPPVYSIPEYQDPEVVTPKVNLIINMAPLVVPEEIMTKKMQVKITTRVDYIAKQISKMHFGGINKIKICRDKFDPQQCLQSSKTLQQCGITHGEVRLYYDFQPVIYPILL